MSNGNGPLTPSRLLGNLAPRWSIVAFWATEMQSTSGLDPEGILHRFGPESDPDTIVQLARATNNTATEIAHRFHRGVHCLTLMEHGQIATACWTSTRAEWVGELDRWFQPALGEAYVWDCLTQQSLRGRGLYPRLLRAILVELQASGYERVWIATEWKNWRSEIGVARAGFRPVGATIAIHSGPLHWFTIVPDSEAPPHLTRALQKALKPRGKMGDAHHCWFIMPSKSPTRALMHVD